MPPTSIKTSKFIAYTKIVPPAIIEMYKIFSSFKILTFSNKVDSKYKIYIIGFKNSNVKAFIIIIN